MCLCAGTRVHASPVAPAPAVEKWENLPGTCKCLSSFPALLTKVQSHPRPRRARRLPPPSGDVSSSGALRTAIACLSNQMHFLCFSPFPAPVIYMNLRVIHLNLSTGRSYVSESNFLLGHAYAHTTCTHLRTCAHACTYMHTKCTAHTYTHAHVCSQTCTNVHTHKHINMHTHTYTHVHMHAHMYTHTRTHTCAHTTHMHTHPTPQALVDPEPFLRCSLASQPWWRQGRRWPVSQVEGESLSCTRTGRAGRDSPCQDPAVFSAQKPGPERKAGSTASRGRRAQPFPSSTVSGS